MRELAFDNLSMASSNTNVLEDSDEEGERKLNYFESTSLLVIEY